jgi:predicted phage tail protein
MKTVKVYGPLRKFLGGKLRFDFHGLNTPSQAIKALCANFPELEKWLIDSKKRGIVYKVFVGKERITEDNLITSYLGPWSERDVLKIIPVIIGAGRGFGQFLAGAALFALSFVVPIPGLGMIGLSLMLGGVYQMLAPPPPAAPKDPARLESFSFSGIVNTSNQGMAIPCVFGRCYTGSIVLSAGIEAK